MADAGASSETPAPGPEQPWSLAVDAVAEALETDPEQGLSREEAARRRDEHGPNRLEETEPVPVWRLLLNQFESAVILLLVAAAVVSLVFARWMEAGAIAAVIAVNTAIGFFTERRAVRSMEALREMSRTRATVRREGSSERISAADLTPGDLVLLEAGDVVGADLRVVESSKLQANESALTGESSPVSKSVEAVDTDAPLAERSSMLFKGTVVTRGSGAGIVVSTGMDTELGRIAEMAESAEHTQTPLERRLDQLARRLIWLVLVLGALVIGIGLLRGKPTLLMVETGVALAVAAIPEGLPIVATLALARGMVRMARRDALVNRLSAVETLGATGVILTDKTGTLTENQMTVTAYALPDGRVEIEGRGLEPEGRFLRDGDPIDPGEDGALRAALEIGVLCVNAEVNEEDGDRRGVGDPMEVALLVAGEKAGIARPDLLERMPEEREEAFDPETRAMATIHKAEDGYRYAVKGSPEAVLADCTRVWDADGGRSIDDAERDEWNKTADRLAADGLRVLALAEKHADDPDADPYEGLTLVGLAGMLDPPREAVKPTLAECRDAGIRVVMVTGDQPGTAASIATRLGMVEEDDPTVITGPEMGDGEPDPSRAEELRSARVFARMAPEQKLRLIALHQDAGSIVAMTGDGVNDSPALRKADIGVAMGARGSEAAKQAADMVLRNDDFRTIVAAVEQGRIIFANIRRSVMFMLCTNVAEVMAVGLATMVGWTLPLRPLQILYLNVLTDVLPALALGLGGGSGDEMKRPPRDPSEAVLTRRHWGAIASWGALLAAAVLGALMAAERGLGLDVEAAVTVSFLTLGFGKLWFTFNLRRPTSGLFRNEITRNPRVWGSIVVCAGLLAAAVYLPGLSDALKTAGLSGRGWLLVLGMSLVPLVVGQVWLVLRGRSLDSVND